MQDVATTTITPVIANMGYLADSRCRREGDASSVVLETAPGSTPEGRADHPVLFDGTVRRPDVVAGGLRCLAAIAASRHADPSPSGAIAMEAVVTAQGDRLRCEVFSACGSIHARLDLFRASLAERDLGAGIAPVDLGATLARALPAIDPTERLHLRVGSVRVDSESAGGRAVRRRIVSAGPWTRALAGVQALACASILRAEYDGAQWRDAAPGAFAAAAPRLAAAGAVRHLVERVRVYGPDADPAAASSWEFDLPGARLSLTLAPEPARGFADLAPLTERMGPLAVEDARRIAPLLAWDARIDVDALGAEARLPRERVTNALSVLAAGGQAGYDLHEQAWFHRPLTFGEDRVPRDEPRLEGAKALVANGAVSVVEGGWWVRGEHGLYRLTRKAGRLQCTCEFEARHRGLRGPCKHALAVRLAAAQAAPVFATAA
jgi:hypothetical protein